MWKKTLMPTNNANQPWTKSAPVRMSVEKDLFHFMMEPVAARITAAAPMNVALSFWPGLNLPSRTFRSPPNVRSHRTSSREKRLKRARSRRKAAPHRPTIANRNATRMPSPAITWMFRASPRSVMIDCPIPNRNIAPVAMHTNHSVAFTQWVTRSARVNRGTRAVRVAPSGALIVPPVRAADPRIDVVAALLPVARDHPTRHLDAAQPLRRLVAVHRRDVQPDRSAVIAADRLAVELVGDDHVGAPGLLEGEALGVLAVEAREAECLALRLH